MIFYPKTSPSSFFLWFDNIYFKKNCIKTQYLLCQILQHMIWKIKQNTLKTVTEEWILSLGASFVIHRFSAFAILLVCLFFSFYVSKTYLSWNNLYHTRQKTWKRRNFQTWGLALKAFWIWVDFNCFLIPNLNYWSWSKNPPSKKFFFLSNPDKVKVQSF